MVNRRKKQAVVVCAVVNKIELGILSRPCGFICELLPAQEDPGDVLLCIPPDIP